MYTQDFTYSQWLRILGVSGALGISIEHFVKRYEEVLDKMQDDPELDKLIKDYLVSIQNTMYDKGN